MLPRPVRFAWLSCVLALAGCFRVTVIDGERDAATDGAAPSMAVSPDASDSALDASHASDSALDASHASDSALDGSYAPDASATSASFPEMPTTFRIQLSGSACYGDCPTYSVALAQDGKVEFYGQTCVARPGTFTKVIGAQDARTFYTRMRQSPLASLSERAARGEDLCPQYWTDSPTSTWAVEIDGKTTSFSRYHGCMGLPELDQLDLLEPLLQATAGIQQWLAPSPFECGSFPVVLGPDASYRVSKDGAAIGVLAVDVRGSSGGPFQLFDCSGAEVQTGDVRVDNLKADVSRWIFLAAPFSKIRLPGELGEVGSLVLDVAASTTSQAPTLSALREYDELALDVAPGTSCTN